ncbi:MAG: site-specific integrase [Bacteroides sp.]|nr:site-specific integrase [Bacteroidales bacterium]MCM1068689.1 site-specific integrase [Prevotella sp.]MCM1353353.1 site-specific integrase [Bacteroides sp.]MCM1402786.1 site-specific integrase [Bacteroides sp.]MCM1442239.1 site-specific integrase [Muribaculum sp.]
MPTLQYRLSSRIYNGQAEVLARFYDGTFSQRAKTRIIVSSTAWDVKNGCLSIPRKTTPDTLILRDKQRMLDGLNDAVCEAWWRDRYNAAEGWLQQTIDDYFAIKPQNNQQRLTIREVCKERNVAKELDAATVRKYNVLLNALDRWASKRSLYIDAFTPSDVENFAAFYRHERTKNGTIERSQNTEVGKIKSLRAIFAYAVQKGYIDKNPTAHFQIPSEVYGDPIFLTAEERDKLYAFQDLPHYIAVQRDIFIFQCYVGCRVGDLIHLTQANVSEDGWLQYIPNKTRRSVQTTVRVPLSRVAQEIIARYASEKEQQLSLRKNYDKTTKEEQPLLPFIHPNNYNAYIHEASKRAGLNRKVMVLNKITFRTETKELWEVTSSHTARKTFMEWMFRETQSERITSSFTGHVEGSRAFARYTHVDDQMKKDILSRLEKKK